MPNLQKLIWRQRRMALVCGGIGLTALAAAAVPALGAGNVAAVAAATHSTTVEIANFVFAPKDLTVTAGTTVTWKNADDSPHRIAAVNGAYASAALDTNDSFSHTFANPGVYKYICSLHPYMAGTIIVK